MKDRLEAIIAAVSIVLLVFRSHCLQHSSRKSAPSGQGGRQEQYISSPLRVTMYPVQSQALYCFMIFHEESRPNMIALVIISLAAMAITILSFRSSRQCPKGCHGCGQCARINRQIRKETEESPFPPTTCRSDQALPPICPPGQ